MAGSRLVNRNVNASRGRTSMRLEPELWDALTEICQREHIRIGELIRRIEARGHAGGRTSAVRVFIVDYYRKGVRIPSDSPNCDQPGLEASASYAAA